MKTVIKNAHIVTYDRVVDGECLVIDGGRISYIGKEPQSCDRVIDADGAWLVPGFVDLHCHGGNGDEFMDADSAGIERIAAFHLAHGTTSMLATTLAAAEDETALALERVSAFIKDYPESSIAGIHLEGPWLNPLQCGAQNVEYMRAPCAKELCALKQKHPAILRVTAAPELEGGMAFGEEGKRLGIVTSCGHTDATFSEIEEAQKHGYSMMTHLYSGMKGTTRKDSFRIGGAVEAGLYLDDMYVEIIADGCHLPEELLRFVYKIKGADRVCLITDAIRAAGMPDGATTRIGSMKNGLEVIVEDGVAKLPDRQSFAGSAATADRLFANMMRVTGDAVAVARMASTTPSRLMGWDDRGEIAVGKRADLVIMDDRYNIKEVILNGEKV